MAYYRLECEDCTLDGDCLFQKNCDVESCNPETENL